MMFGTIVVSMSGIALPVLAGVLLMPRSESQRVVTSPHGEQRPWLPLRRSRGYLNALSAAIRQRHLPGSVAPGSSVRYG
jgi:hypothetical protein